MSYYTYENWSARGQAIWRYILEVYGRECKE